MICQSGLKWGMLGGGEGETTDCIIMLRYTLDNRRTTFYINLFLFSSGMVYNYWQYEKDKAPWAVLKKRL